jgi:hypothetical protein
LFKIIATVILITASGEQAFEMEYGGLVFPDKHTCESFLQSKQPDLRRGIVQSFKFYDTSLKEVKELKCKTIK